MKTLLLYAQPTLLQPAVHGKLKLAWDGTDCSVAADTNSLLLAASEIPEASLHYPIIFIGGDKGGPFSLAVLLGLGESSNLFVEGGGRWAAGSYVPAFMRRYPFVLLEEVPAQLSVGYDAACPGFSEERGEPLFGEAGEPAPLLQHAVAFMEEFHRDMEMTRAFADMLARMGLLAPRGIEVSQGPGQPARALQGFHAVDEQALAALPASDLAELARSPALGWIYLHLNSLRLVSRLAARQSASSGVLTAPPAAPSSVAKSGKGGGKRRSGKT